MGRKVNQIDIKNNEIINRFDSISEANSFMGKSRDSNPIRFTCNGTQKQAYGYKWNFV